MFKYSIRYIHSINPSLAKINNNATKLIINSITDNINYNYNSALQASKEFEKLTFENNVNYQQIPDDSKFIDKYYNDLIEYKLKLDVVEYNDFKTISNLFKSLSELKPSDEVEIKKFDLFIYDLIKLFKMNNCHLFILDLLIQNKELFDKFETINKQSAC
ncbi:hypothetical protein CANARDRAFT_9391 [[Candida] arabinofermentans NRRL YB-2248]|uniref:Uncharacterized protein n=1 Tax=[Candida] arabinofermentans NRRL YB-2248 TaxID=983967 RepID=A0A1E4SVW9_9ASCO|nr:hypothetical protein CANARDRAFT_9391 [[Candida] arabinofermentans NRRL YB-2248]